MSVLRGEPQTGIEVLAAAAVAYLVRKARRVAARGDAEVDRALDQGMDALHDLVTQKLGSDPALTSLETQAQAGAETDRTKRRVTDAIADAAEADPDFAGRLDQLISELREQEASTGGVSAPGGIAAGGDVYQHAESGGVIAHDIHGPVSTGNPPAPGPGQQS